MKDIPAYQPEIRFADIDAMGHVNNAVYFSYFEQARMHFFKHSIGQWDWNEHGILVAHNEIDYKLPIFLHDQVQIRIACTHLGSRSFTISYEVVKITDKGEQLCSTGNSVLVCFNHHTQSTQPVPQEWRELFQSSLGAQ